MKGKNIENKKMKEPVKLQKVLNPKLISLILHNVSKNPKDAQIEFVHYVLEIMNTIIYNKELRQVLLEVKMACVKDLPEMTVEEYQKSHYIQYLRYIEKLP